MIDPAKYKEFFGDGRFSEYVIENVIKAFTNDTDLLIDGGANQGRHTLVGLSTGASVVAVEPIPEMCEKIRALVQNEDADRLTVLQMALSDSPGRTSFTYCPTRSTLSGLHSRERTKTLETHQLTVEKSTIDLIVRDVCRRQPAIIKLDLEGGEHDAIRGAGQTLKHTPVLIFEHGGQEGAALYGYTYEEYYNLLKQSGYTLLQINGRDCLVEDFQKPRHWNYVALNPQLSRHNALLQSFDYLVADAAQKMLSLHGVETTV